MDLKQFGKRLALARKRAGFTKETAAQRLLMYPGGIYDYENGLVQPGIARVVELATLYNVSIDWLCNGYPGKTVVFFNTEAELTALTGLDHNALWDAGFDLDDWDWGFVSDTEWTQDWNTEHPEYEYMILNWMDSHCVGYEHTVYNGKHYYIQYHS